MNTEHTNQPRQAEPVNQQLLALVKSFGHKTGCSKNAFGEQCTCGVDDAIAAAEQAQQAEPRCACGDSLTSDAMCANCLAAQPPAVATDAITDAMEANAWRAALRGLCTGRELMTPDECAEHVRHRIESAKSGTHRPDGYALVPIKPTDTMLDAAVSAGDEPGSDYYTIYAAMLAAAQKGGEA